MGVLSSSSKIVTSFFTADYNLNQAVAKFISVAKFSSWQILTGSLHRFQIKKYPNVTMETHVPTTHKTCPNLVLHPEIDMNCVNPALGGLFLLDKKFVDNDVLDSVNDTLMPSGWKPYFREDFLAAVNVAGVYNLYTYVDHMSHVTHPGGDTTSETMSVRIRIPNINGISDNVVGTPVGTVEQLEEDEQVDQLSMIASTIDQPVSSTMPVLPLSPLSPVSLLSPVHPLSPLSPSLLSPVHLLSPLSPLSPVSLLSPVHPLSTLSPVHPLSPSDSFSQLPLLSPSDSLPLLPSVYGSGKSLPSVYGSGKSYKKCPIIKSTPETVNTNKRKLAMIPEANNFKVRKAMRTTFESIRKVMKSSNDCNKSFSSAIRSMTNTFVAEQGVPLVLMMPPRDGDRCVVRKAKTLQWVTVIGITATTITVQVEKKQYPDKPSQQWEFHFCNGGWECDTCTLIL